MTAFSPEIREGELSDLPDLARWIVAKLVGFDPFCLWLQGEMGAGKTTLVGHLMREFGLPSHVPVPSPTYTLANDYKIEDRLFVHLDFYRISDDFSLAELGLDHVGPIRGYFVEWPDLPPGDQSLPASHILRILPLDHNRREFSLVQI